MYIQIITSDPDAYAGCLTGEIFRIAHAACNTLRGEDVIVIASKDTYGRTLRDRFLQAVEYLQDDAAHVAIA